MRSAIYKIENAKNGKIYVGSAVNVLDRRASHFSLLRLGKHQNSHLQSAWEKYGEESFHFVILEYVDDKKMLLQREQKWIDELRVSNPSIGYNKNPIAGSAIGSKRSEETKKKMSMSRIGNKSHLGRKFSAEHIANLSAGQRGRTWSAESRAKISERMMGNKRGLGIKRGQMSQETREKISKGLMGKTKGIPKSAETRARISEAHIRFHRAKSEQC